MRVPILHRMSLPGLVGAVILGGLLTAGTASPATATGSAASRTLLTVTGTPAVTGQQVYLRAVVKPVAGTGTAPTGSVSFLDGATIVGTAPLTTSATGAQVAQLKHGFAAGSHSLTARYEGDATYAPSTSLPASLSVAKAASTAKITKSPATAGKYNVAVVEKPVKPGAGIPTGVVSIQVDNLAPQSVALSPTGHAHITVALAPGTHTAKVVYGGDPNFTGNTTSVSFTVP